MSKAVQFKTVAITPTVAKMATEAVLAHPGSNAMNPERTIMLLGACMMIAKGAEAVDVTFYTTKDGLVVPSFTGNSSTHAQAHARLSSGLLRERFWGITKPVAIANPVWNGPVVSGVSNTTGKNLTVLYTQVG